MNLKEKFILISKSNPLKYLVKGRKFKAGRNNSGTITVRHKGSKIKKKQRIIDNYRAIWHIYYRIIKFEYDPNRKTLVSLLSYSVGIFSYVVAIENSIIFSKLMDGIKIKLKAGVSTIGLKTKKKFFISNLEVKPFKGSKLLRSSGAYGKIITKRKNKIVVKLKSGKMKIVSSYCMLTLGKILNFNYYLQRYKKAGLSRLKNIRPHVRGVAMNPVDHPYGGGEGKKSKKSILMSPWGKLQRFKKTKIK